jgi:hypothetical protein
MMKTIQIPEPSHANLNFHPYVAVDRAVFVLDENLLNLRPLLRELGFSVFSLTPGLKETRIDHPSTAHEDVAQLLCQRVFVTSRADKFRHAAAVHEFSIIDIAGCVLDPEALTQEISQHWNQLRLREKQPFVFRLRKNGLPVLEDIE